MQKKQENAPRVCKNALKEALGDALKGVLVCVFDEIDSTNAEAKRMALEGFRGDALLVAHSQTAGRGRMGRSFYSPAQTGVYFSILHTLQAPLCDAVAVTSAAAVAVMRAVRSLTGIQTEIKWVNDLYYRKKKICGILTESTCTGEHTHVIVGIGINLDTSDFPTELADIAGSLDVHIDADLLIAEILREITEYLRDPAGREWLGEYRTHSMVLGHRVTWADDGVTHAGTAVGIDADGALLIEKDDGESIRLHTGEISLRTLNE